MNTKMRKVGLGLLGLILVVTLILMNVNIKVGPQSEDSNLALTVTVGDTVNAAGIIPDVVGVNSAAVQAALNLVATTGGEVSLISPVYTFTGTVSRAIPNVVFKLNGATITNNASTPLFSAGSQSGWAFYDGKLDAGGITLTSATDYSLNNITIGTTYYAFKTSGTSTVGNITATTGNITTLNAPTGRTASYVIAASDAPAIVKAQADYVLTGTDDQTIINTVIGLCGDGSIIDIIGDNISLSAKVTINLATKKISLRGSNTIVTLTGAGGIPGFEISNQPAYINSFSVLSGFDIDGQDKTVGRIGVQFIDCLYLPRLENISIHDMGYAVLLSTVGVSQQEGLTISHAWFYDNTHSIWFPNGAISYSTVFLDDVNFNIPAGCDGIYIGNGTAIPDSYMKINMWIQGAGATGIFLDGALGGSMIIGKIENTDPATSYGIDIGTNAVTPQWEIKLELSGDYLQNFIHNPYGKDIRFVQSPELTKSISISSLVNADIKMPFLDGVGIQSKDLSGNFHNALLINTPTWGTSNQLGNLILNGTNQGATIPDVSVGGNRTFIVVTTPNFAESEDAYRYLFDIQIDANNRVNVLKFNNGGNNIISFDYKGGGSEKTANAILGFTQNENMVLIFTYNDTTKIGNFYYKGNIVATFTGATTISSTIGILNLGSSYAGAGAGSTWKGGLKLFVSLPRCIGTNEAFDLTKQLSRLAGTDNILPGEIRTASGSLTAGNANAIGFAWHDPEAQDVFISKVVVEVTTPGGTALSVLQVGIADDATGTNLGAEYFTGLDLNSAAICDSWNATQTGAQTGLLTLQDSASATDGWIVGKILTQNAASLAGKYYIFYVGK
jgi:hypothetical protein